MLKSVHVYNTYVIYIIIVVIDLCEIYFKRNGCVQKKENILMSTMHKIIYRIHIPIIYKLLKLSFEKKKKEITKKKIIL